MVMRHNHVRFAFAALATLVFGVFMGSVALAQHFQNYSVILSDTRPAKSSQFLFTFRPSEDLPPGSQLRFEFDPALTIPSAVSSTDGAFTINGTAETLANTNGTSTHGYAKSGGLIVLTTASSTTIAANSVLRVTIGRDGGFITPGPGSYGVDTNAYSATGTYFEGNASRFIIVEPVTLNISGVASAPPAIPPTTTSPPPVFVSGTPGVVKCDVTGDQNVDQLDLAVLEAFWHGYPEPSIDCFLDGRIDIRDLGVLFYKWTPGVPPIPALAVAIGPPLPVDEPRLGFVIPSSTEWVPGDRFILYVTLSTGDRAVDAAQVTLHYPETLLAARQVFAEPSVFPYWIERPAVIAPGTISFTGGIPKGFVGSNAVLIAIEFEALQPGTAVVSSDESSLAVHADEIGSPVLFPVERAFIPIVAAVSPLLPPKVPTPPPVPPSQLRPPPPIAPTPISPAPPSAPSPLIGVLLPPVRPSEPFQFIIPSPVVRSSSHTDQNRWYSSRRVELDWPDHQAGDQYSYVVDRGPLAYPDATPETAERSLPLLLPDDGIWTFLIRRIRGTEASAPSAYYLHVDATPPAPFDAQATSFPSTLGVRYLVTFHATDAMSGIAGYEIREGEERTLQTGEAYFLRDVRPGEHAVEVIARDLAGNERHAFVRVSIPYVIALPGVPSIVIPQFAFLVTTLILLLLLISWIVFRRPRV